MEVHKKRPRGSSGPRLNPRSLSPRSPPFRVHASAYGRVADEVGVVGGAQQHMGEHAGGQLLHRCLSAPGSAAGSEHTAAQRGARALHLHRMPTATRQPRQAYVVAGPVASSPSRCSLCIPWGAFCCSCGRRGRRFEAGFGHPKLDQRPPAATDPPAAAAVGAIFDHANRLRSSSCSACI